MLMISCNLSTSSLKLLKLLLLWLNRVTTYRHRLLRVDPGCPDEVGLGYVYFAGLL